MDQLRGGGGGGAGAGLRPVSRGVIVFQWRELPRDIGGQGADAVKVNILAKMAKNIITLAWL